MDLRDAGRDLLIGSSCVGCGAPGRVLCPVCAHALPRCSRPAWPTPTPPGLAPPYAAGAYEGLLKALVNAHKEQAVLSLAGPLGEVLAGVVRGVVPDGALGPAGGPSRPLLLVPVPSRSAVVRSRGHDPLLRVARAAAVLLRRRGVRAGVRLLLRTHGAVRDQALLGAAERAGNLQGSMRARASARARVPAGASVVVVDDVLTTGATAREAQRALEEVGVRVDAVAVVAATIRRWAPGPGLPSPAYRSTGEATTVSSWSPSGSVVASPESLAGGSLVPGPAVRRAWPTGG